MGQTVGFIIWCICGCVFIGMGIYALFSEKPMRFWTNDRLFEVNDVKKYNRAVARLYCVDGIVLILLGTPLLFGSVWVLFSIFGVAALGIGSMAVYTTKIESKYRK